MLLCSCRVNWTGFRNKNWLLFRPSTPPHGCINACASQGVVQKCGKKKPRAAGSLTNPVSGSHEVQGHKTAGEQSEQLVATEEACSCLSPLSHPWVQTPAKGSQMWEPGWEQAVCYVTQSQGRRKRQCCPNSSRSLLYHLGTADSKGRKLNWAQNCFLLS